MNLAYSFLCIAKKSPFMSINFCNYPSIHLAEHETFVLVVTRLIVYLRLSLHFYGRPKIDNCVYQHGEQMPPCFGFTKSGFQPNSLSCPKRSGNCFSPFLFCLSTAFSFYLLSFWKLASEFLRSHQASGKAWGLLDISPGTHYTASVATFFISSIFFFNLFPLFFFISPLEHIVLRQWAL